MLVLEIVLPVLSHHRTRKAEEGRSSTPDEQCCSDGGIVTTLIQANSRQLSWEEEGGVNH